MGQNKRVYFACMSVGFAECGTNTFVAAHGLTSIGTSVEIGQTEEYEIGQLAKYATIEDVPNVTATVEKKLDGYCPVYLLATKGAPTASLAGRSNAKTTVGLSIFSDLQDSASGTPLTQITMSGMYVNSLGYQFPIQGPYTESVSLIGQNRVYSNSFSAPTFNNTDEPLAVAGGSGSIQDRPDILMGPTNTTNPTKSLFPIDIPGITASGTNELSGGRYGATLQSIRVNSSFNREAMLQQGLRAPFHRYMQFPVAVTSEFEIIADENADGVSVAEANEANVTERKIYIMLKDGLRLDLGNKNKMTNMSMGGANAAQNGGNMTITYSYRNVNDLSVYHPQDVTTALRP